MIVHDVTQVRRTSDRLAALARFDSQTGLANRNWFTERLSQELSRTRRSGSGAALLWIDLDGFKEVNDRHGHAAGDLVLHETATRLQGLGRRQDVVGRIGGDEFAMLITDVARPEDLEVLAERVLDALRKPFELGQGMENLSGSVGIAYAPTDGRDAESLLQSADTAMYSAKERGRDCHVYFEPLMNEMAIERAVRRHELTAAVQDRAFTMHYQPLVDAVTNEPRAVEALVRWRRGDELVTAAEFIELAEETGQMRSLGRLTFDLVAEDIRRLVDVHGMRALPMAVNLSASQLEERALVDLLPQWDAADGFHDLIAEVTESQALQAGGDAFDALRLLRRLGATIGIDDFGTGYSSLLVLEQLHPGIIKIDKSLLGGAERGRRRRGVLAAAAELGHLLEATTVLEGVETSEQQALAVELGVDWVQGFHIARPMALDDLADWIHAAPAAGGAPATP